MRRSLLQLLGILILAVGPVLPSLHLALSPHRFCARHRAFEDVGEQANDDTGSDDRRPTRDEPHEHRRCPLATLILQSAIRVSGPELLDARTPQQAHDTAPPRQAPPRHGPPTVHVAPKTSPPASSAV